MYTTEYATAQPAFTNAVQYQQPMFYQPPAYTTTEYTTLQPAYTAAVPHQVSTIHSVVPPAVMVMPPLTPTPRKAMLWREPILTNFGEIILMGEFSNAMRQVKHALVPWLQQINQERATQGLHQVGIREYTIKQRQQTLCFAVQDSEKSKRNLVIFVMPGTGIRYLDNPKDGIDYKHLHRQANNGFNEIMACIVGPIVDPRLTRAGFAAGEQDPDHQELCDPIIHASGIFQGDAVALRLLKTGKLFSFSQYMNNAQFAQLTKIVRRLSTKCHLSDAKAKVKFHS
jgi:hypothetical protein